MQAFLERLDAVDVFLMEADAAFAFDTLLADLRDTAIPNLACFPRIGRRSLNQPPQSAKAMAQLAALATGSLNALREYLHGDYWMLFVAMDADSAVHLLSIRHYRQLSFNFVRLWQSGNAQTKN